MDTRNQLFSRWLDPRLEAIGGDTGVYIENLATVEVFARGEDTPVVAASVIKLPVLCAVARRVQQGRADWSERLVCAKKRARAALRCAVVL